MRLMITGANSMIGRALQLKLYEYILFYTVFGEPTFGLGDELTILPVFHHEFDLTSYIDTQAAFTKFKPTHVINLAGYNGGIGLNKEKPADIYRINTLIAINVLDVAHQKGVEKLVSLIPSCSYPSYDRVFEYEYYEGKPHDTVACHGLAKRNLVAYSEMLNKQFGCNFVTLCCNTVFGPWDNFGTTGKVVGSLIGKFVEAKHAGLPRVTLWGTGKPKRGLIYSLDVADAILEGLEKYNDSSLPLNIESTELTIAELAYIIKDAAKYEGEIVWDLSKPDGQMRKMIDFSKSQDILSYKPKHSITEDIRSTVEWYEAQFIKGTK